MPPKRRLAEAFAELSLVIGLIRPQVRDHAGAPSNNATEPQPILLDAATGEREVPLRLGDDSVATGRIPGSA